MKVKLRLTREAKECVIWPVSAAKYFKFCISLVLKPIVDKTANK